jgi:hypothetical protein
MASEVSDGVAVDGAREWEDTPGLVWALYVGIICSGLGLQSDYSNSFCVLGLC